jgi:hypothetical protein
LTRTAHACVSDQGRRLAQDLHHLGPRQLLAIRITEAVVVEQRGRVDRDARFRLRLLRLDVVAQRLLVRKRESELFRVLGIHPVEPRLVFQALPAVRGDAHAACRAHYPVRMQRGASERVRPTARPAGDREAVEAELVGDRDHVVDRIGDAAAVPSRGAAVTGAIVRDEAHAEPSVELFVGPALQPTTRCSVHAEDREPARVTPHRERNGASIARLQSP